jgi:hypothetical protein
VFFFRRTQEDAENKPSCLENKPGETRDEPEFAYFRDLIHVFAIGFAWVRFGFGNAQFEPSPELHKRITQSNGR